MHGGCGLSVVISGWVWGCGNCETISCVLCFRLGSCYRLGGLVCSEIFVGLYRLWVLVVLFVLLLSGGE